MLLRGTDTFFLWCPQKEDAEEVQLVHEVYAAAQQYGEFLEKGVALDLHVPVQPSAAAMDLRVPGQPSAVISGLLLGKRLLVRRTDFAASPEPVKIQLHGRELSVKPVPGKCQVLSLE
jgi:hypothetical protein